MIPNKKLNFNSKYLMNYISKGQRLSFNFKYIVAWTYLVLINIANLLLFNFLSIMPTKLQITFVYCFVLTNIFLILGNFLYMFHYKVIQMGEFINYLRFVRYYFFINFNVLFFLLIKLCSEFKSANIEELLMLFIFIMIASNIMYLAYFFELDYTLFELIILIIPLCISSLALALIFSKNCDKIIKVLLCEVSKIVYYIFLVILYHNFSFLKKHENMTKLMEFLELTVNFINENVPNGFSVYNSLNFKNKYDKKLVYEKNLTKFFSKNFENNEICNIFKEYFINKFKSEEVNKDFNKLNSIPIPYKNLIKESLLIQQEPAYSLNMFPKDKINILPKTISCNNLPIVLNKEQIEKFKNSNPNLNQIYADFKKNKRKLTFSKNISEDYFSNLLKLKTNNTRNQTNIISNNTENENVIKFANKNQTENSSNLPKLYLKILKNLDYNKLFTKNVTIIEIFKVFDGGNKKITVFDFINLLLDYEELFIEESEIGPFLIFSESDEKNSLFFSICLKKYKYSTESFYSILLKNLDIYLILKNEGCLYYQNEVKNHNITDLDQIPRVISIDKVKENNLPFFMNNEIKKKSCKKSFFKLSEDNEKRDNENRSSRKQIDLLNYNLERHSSLTVITKNLNDYLVNKELVQIINRPSLTANNNVLINPKTTGDPKVAALIHDFKNVIYDYTLNINLILEKLGQDKIKQLSDDMDNITVLESYILSLIKFLNDYIHNNEFLMNKNVSQIDLIYMIKLMEKIFKRRLNYDNFKKESHFIKNIDINAFIQPEFDINSIKRLYPYNKELIISLLYNTISNSYKYTNQGHITIKLENDVFTNNLILSIQDTGSGIPVSILNNWGKPFNNIDNSIGSGLGQFIILSIAASLGISIPKPESSKSGTTVKIIFPLTSMSVDSPTLRQIKEAQPLNKNNELIKSNILNEELSHSKSDIISGKEKDDIYILYLDDCQILLDAFEKILNKYEGKRNFNIILKKASNFHEFFFEVNNFLAFNCSFDFLVLDHNLNGYLTGIDCADFTIRLYKKAIPNFTENSCNIFFMTEELNYFENNHMRYPGIIKKERIFCKNDKKKVICKIFEIIEKKELLI